MDSAPSDPLSITDGLGYIRYFDSRGRRRLESTHSTDRNDAEKLLRKRLSAKDHGVRPEAAIGTLTLKEATDDLIADYTTNGRRSLPEVKRKIELSTPGPLPKVSPAIRYLRREGLMAHCGAYGE